MSKNTDQEDNKLTLLNIIHNGLRLRETFTSCFIFGEFANELLYSISTEKTWIFFKGSGSLFEFHRSILQQLKLWINETNGETIHPITLPTSVSSNSMKTNLSSSDEDKLIEYLCELSRKISMQIAIPFFSQLPAETVRFLNKLFYHQNHQIHLILSESICQNSDQFHHYHNIFFKLHQEMPTKTLPNLVMINTKTHLKINHFSYDIPTGYIDQPLDTNLNLFIEKGEYEKATNKIQEMLKTKINDDERIRLWILLLQKNVGNDIKDLADEAEIYRQTPEFLSAIKHQQIRFYTALIDIHGLSNENMLVMKLINKSQYLLPKSFKITLRENDNYSDLHLRSTFFTYTVTHSAQSLASRLTKLSLQYDKYDHTAPDGSVMKYIKETVQREFVGYDQEYITIALFKVYQKFNRHIDKPSIDELELEIKNYVFKVKPLLETQFSIIEYQSEIPVISAALEKGFVAFTYILNGLEWMLKEQLFCSKLIDSMARIVILYQSVLKKNITETRFLFNEIERLVSKYPKNVSLLYSYYYTIPLFRKLNDNDITNLEKTITVAMQQGNVNMVGTLGQLVMHYDFAFVDDIQYRYEKKRRIIMNMLPFLLNRRSHLYFLLTSISTLNHDLILLGIDDLQGNDIIPNSTLITLVQQIVNENNIAVNPIVSLLFPYRNDDYSLFQISHLSNNELRLLILYLENNMVGVYIAMTYKIFGCLVKQDMVKAILMVNAFYQIKLDKLNVTMALPIRILSGMCISLITAIHYADNRTISDTLKKRVISTPYTITKKVVNYLAHAYIKPLTLEYESGLIAQNEKTLLVFSNATKWATQYIKYGASKMMKSVNKVLQSLNWSTDQEITIENKLGLAITLRSIVLLLEKHSRHSPIEASHLEYYTSKAYLLFKETHTTTIAQDILQKYPKSASNSSSVIINNIKNCIIGGSERSWVDTFALLRDDENFNYYTDLLQEFHIAYGKRVIMKSPKNTLNKPRPPIVIEDSIKKVIESYSSIKDYDKSNTYIFPHLRTVLVGALKEYIRLYLPVILENMMSQSIDDVTIAILTRENRKGWDVLTYDLWKSDFERHDVDKTKIPMSIVKRSPLNAITTYHKPENIYSGDPYYNLLFKSITEEGLIVIQCSSACFVIFCHCPIKPKIELEAPFFLAVLDILISDIVKFSVRKESRSSMISTTPSENSKQSIDKDSLSDNSSDLFQEVNYNISEIVQLTGALKTLKEKMIDNTLINTDSKVLRDYFNIIYKYKNKSIVKSLFDDIKKIAQSQQESMAKIINKTLDAGHDKTVLVNFYLLIKHELFSKLELIPAVTEYLHKPEFNPPIELVVWIEQQNFNYLANYGFHNLITTNSWKPVTAFGQYALKTQSHENLVFTMAFRYLSSNNMFLSPEFKILIKLYIIGEDDVGILNINDDLSKIELINFYKNADALYGNYSQYMDNVLRQVFEIIKTDIYGKFMKPLTKID